MDLILWRHAEAADGVPDMARQLTARGEKQAEEVGRWLRARLPGQTRILVSPAQRTLQTARALTDEFKVVRELSPGAAPAAVLDAAAAAWKSGHQGGRQVPLKELSGAVGEGLGLGRRGARRG